VKNSLDSRNVSPSFPSVPSPRGVHATELLTLILQQCVLGDDGGNSLTWNRSSSSSRRAFYDPKQPRLLSEQEIAELSPAECDAACLQIDQILVNILQSQSHQYI
jgi:hypothetical protein